MENAVVYPKFRWVVAFTSAWAWFTFGVIVLTYSPMFPVMAKELRVEIGTLVIGVMAVNSIACAAGTMLCGPLIDKVGPRKILLGSSILVLIYCLLIPVCSSTYWQLVSLRIYGGFACGPLFATMAALTQRWFPRNEHGMVIGINKGVFAVGSGFLFLTVPSLMQRFHGDWRTVSALGGVLLFIQVVLVTIILFGNEPVAVHHAPRAGTSRSDAWTKTIRLPVFWAGALLLAVAQGLMQSVNGVMPSYLMTPSPMGLGLKPFASGHTMTFIQVGMVVSGVLIGVLLRYMFRGSVKWLAASSFLAAGVVVYSVSLSIAQTNLSLSFFFIGALMNIGFPAVSVFITANYPPHILGKVFGISSGISVFGGALFSGICGAILNQTRSYSAVFGFLLIVGAAGFILAVSMLNPVRAFKPAQEVELVHAGGG